MISHENFMPNNYAALPSELSDYKNSRVVIVSVPYDLTTTYVPGTRNGPEAVIKASQHMETFDEELAQETAEIGIHTLPGLEPSCNGERMIEHVRDVCRQIIIDNKFPVMLGGEHSVTYGMIKAFLESGKKDLGVVQFDAHADLRWRYLDSVYSHACIGHIVQENCPLTQIGIRSMSKEEYDFLASPSSFNVKTFYAKDIAGRTDWIDACVAQLPEDVYLTIDLDVFDPSEMPAVGTPEPGGLRWYEMTGLLRTIAEQKNIIGFDVVELCPQPGNAAPDFLASKLVYKLLGYCFRT